MTLFAIRTGSASRHCDIQRFSRPRTHLIAHRGRSNGIKAATSNAGVAGGDAGYLFNGSFSFDDTAMANKVDSGTVVVHGGERDGRPRVSDSLTTPIVQTSTFTFKNTAELIAYQEGTYGSFEYGRYGNPTTKACEEKIRILEGAEDCLLSSSGMNSATTMLLALVPPGGHIVTTTGEFISLSILSTPQLLFFTYTSAAKLSNRN